MGINDLMEWELAAYEFSMIINTFDNPDIDFLSSRVNAKCNKYISWKRDPDAQNIDAYIGSLSSSLCFNIKHIE